MLEIRNLTLSYDGSHKVLDGLDFQLRTNEIVLIGGQTGSGKSTLAQCITGVIRSKSLQSLNGTITIEEESVLEQDTSYIAKRIGLVQQDPESQICTLNVVDEIAFGPENFNVSSKDIEQILAESLEDVAASYLVGRSTHALSGGERQRVVIASILASRPRYLILDEPSSSIDPKGLQILKKLLARLRDAGMGILCIEHNIHQMHDIANRILILQDGRLEPANISTIPIPILPVPSPPSDSEGVPLLGAEHLSFSYGDIHAVDDVSINFYPGEIVAFMGDNGSGKTTLLSLLSGLLSPTAGEVYLSGQPLSTIPVSDLARRMSVIFQNPNHQIFERTVWKDQILAIDLLDLEREANLKRSEGLLNDVGLGDKLERNPFSLSYGQKRRLNITSTGFYDSAVHLFDEPFIGQDAGGIEFIANQIRYFQRQGHLSIISTHDPVFATSCCTRVIFMRNGSILVDADPEKVMNWLRQNGESYYTLGGSN